MGAVKSRRQTPRPEHSAVPAAMRSRGAGSPAHTNCTGQLKGRGDGEALALAVMDGETEAVVDILGDTDDDGARDGD